MKKAQILSAIALALALGIVIPAAGANATIVTIKDGLAVTDEDEEKKVNDAIKAGKDSCGWHLVGQVKTYYYDEYDNLIVVLDAAADAVEGTEKIQYTNLKGSFKTTISTLKGIVEKLPSGVKEEVPESVKTYKDLVTFINGQITIIKNEATKYRPNTDSTDEDIYGAYNTAINAFLGDAAKDGLLKTAQNAIDTVKDARAKLIAAEIAGITEDEKFNAEDTTAKYDYAEEVKAANALKSTDNGTCTVAKTRNLKKAIKYAQNMLDSDSNFTTADAEKAIANITKAMNGGTITDADTPAIDDTTLKPGNTGLVGSAEGTATTVSIVAGLATALTALGAGVVVYRNARREK